MKKASASGPAFYRRRPGEITSLIALALYRYAATVRFCQLGDLRNRRFRFRVGTGFFLMRLGPVGAWPAGQA